jgi:hypothetical protein
MVEGEVKVLFKIRRDDKNVTLKDVFEKLEEIRKKEPDQDVYFDGDEFAICGRPIPKIEKHDEHHHHGKKKGQQTKLSSA